MSVVSLDDRGHEQCRLTIAVEPTDNDGHSGVNTGDGQEEGTVLRLVVARGTEERRESSEGNEQGEDDEEEAVLGEIGEDGNSHGKDEGDSPGWDGEELSPDCAVTEGPDDRGGKVGVGICRDDESEVHKTTSNDAV